MSTARRHALAVLLASALAPLVSRADETPFLSGERLAAAFAGATLIGSNWAEYYAPDGVIVGKVRYLGIVRHFRGRWIARDDRVCFEYERAEYNTCSKFRLLGERMWHFAIDGRPKKDGESRRLPGNRLEEFR